MAYPAYLSFVTQGRNKALGGLSDRTKWNMINTLWPFLAPLARPSPWDYFRRTGWGAPLYPGLDALNRMELAKYTSPAWSRYLADKGGSATEVLKPTEQAPATPRLGQVSKYGVVTYYGAPTRRPSRASQKRQYEELAQRLLEETAAQTPTEALPHEMPAPRTPEETLPYVASPGTQVTPAGEVPAVRYEIGKTFEEPLGIIGHEPNTQTILVHEPNGQTRTVRPGEQFRMEYPHPGTYVLESVGENGLITARDVQSGQLITLDSRTARTGGPKEPVITFTIPQTSEAQQAYYTALADIKRHLDTEAVRVAGRDFASLPSNMRENVMAGALANYLIEAGAKFGPEAGDTPYMALYDTLRRLGYSEKQAADTLRAGGAFVGQPAMQTRPVEERREQVDAFLSEFSNRMLQKAGLDPEDLQDERRRQRVASRIESLLRDQVAPYIVQEYLKGADAETVGAMVKIASMGANVPEDEIWKYIVLYGEEIPRRKSILPREAMQTLSLRAALPSQDTGMSRFRKYLAMTAPPYLYLWMGLQGKRLLEKWRQSRR